MSLLARVRQRKLVQWTIAYCAFAWVVAQVAVNVGGHWGLSESLLRGLDVGLAGGIPVAAIIAWNHGERGRQAVSMGEGLLIVVVSALGLLVAWQVATDTPAPPPPVVVLGVSGGMGLAGSPEMSVLHERVVDALLTDIGLTVWATRSLTEPWEVARTRLMVGANREPYLVFAIGLIALSDSTALRLTISDGESGQVLATDTYTFKQPSAAVPHWLDDRALPLFTAGLERWRATQKTIQRTAN